MITDEDRRKLGDLSMRALDAIAEYGEDAELVGATLLFDVRVPADGDRDGAHYGNYVSLPGMSPNHVGGMCQSQAYWLLALGLRGS